MFITFNGLYENYRTKTTYYRRINIYSIEISCKTGFTDLKVTFKLIIVIRKSGISK